MISYRDRTYCNFRDCAAFGPCPRSYTDDVRADAMLADLPVSIFAHRPECFVLSEDAETEYELRERQRMDALEVLQEVLRDVQD